MKRILVTGIALACLSAPRVAHASDWIASGPDNRTKIVAGACVSESHTSEGPIGSELSKRTTPYYCDRAMVTEYRDGRIMFQTATSGTTPADVIGFAGPLRPDRVDVNRIYLPGRSQLQGEGYCFFDSAGFACVAKVDEGSHRTVASVTFHFAPGEGI